MVMAGFQHSVMKHNVMQGTAASLSYHIPQRRNGWRTFLCNEQHHFAGPQPQSQL